ncbi:MAG: hypothetical protein JSR86_18785 [Proteobacteria bacterium]|nr:hypothetical protein [Pseudomonadota bacterium]
MNQSFRATRRAARPLGVTALAAATLASASVARAQDGIDRVLSVADVIDSEQCAVVRIGFNMPVNMVSSFPLDTGDELRIRVKSAPGSVPPSAMQTRESLHPPSSTLASITGIAYEGDRPEGPTLDISFRRPVFFHVGQGADFRSIIVAISDHADTACTPDFRPIASAPIAANGAVAPPQPRNAAGELPLPLRAADPNASAQSVSRLQDARTALTGKDYPRAIQLLTAVVEGPESALTPEALELLGLARERNGQLAHAKAEYEEFLRRYPKGDAADRVRQRLAGVLAVGSAPKPELRRPGQPATPQQPRVAWEFGGSVSEYFLYDDGYHRTDDITSGHTITDNQVNQDQLLTTVDGIATARGPGYVARGRVSATFTDDMLAGAKNQGTVSALYIEAMDTRQHVFGRFGRQTRSTGGVLGRFDGGLFSLKVAPEVKFEVAGGYPVDSSKVLHVDTSRPFVATSLALGRFRKAWDADIYFVRQNNHNLIDREAIGGELRYLDSSRSVFASIDYDVHFKRVNLALLNATTTFKDRTSVSVAVDYRQSPLLTSNNALIGQTLTNIVDLEPIYGADGIYQLAADRSATSKSVTVSVAHPFNEKFSFNADATVSNIGPTPASGGVAAGPSTGTEEYLSAQLIGSGLLKSGDLGIVGFRFANTGASYRYILDLNTRYPISRALRVNPRLILSYRDNKVTPGTEFSTKPSIRVNYYFRKHYQIELESGGEWTVDRSQVSHDTTLGYYLNMGFRADF